MTGSAPEPKPRLLVELPGPAVGRTLTESSILVLPVGSLEHHGEHLPLATDLITAEAMARAVSAQAVVEGLDVWVLPSLAYTKSDEHAWAPGTLWVNATTLFETVVDIGRSLTTLPTKTLVFYNGHGGNTALLQVCLRELRRRFGLRTFLMGTGSPAGDGTNGPDERGFGIHGGHSETSLLMYLRPELVDMSRAVRAVPDHLADFQRIGFNGFPVAFGWTSDDFGSGGVVGDPTGATVEWGEQLYHRALAGGLASLYEVARFSHLPPS